MDFKTMNRIDVGLRIKQLRAERNITQRDLASLTGITPASIADIENGKYSVGIDKLIRILDSLDSEIEIIKKAAK